MGRPWLWQLEPFLGKDWNLAGTAHEGSHDLDQVQIGTKRYGFWELAPDATLDLPGGLIELHDFELPAPRIRDAPLSDVRGMTAAW